MRKKWIWLAVAIPLLLLFLCGAFFFLCSGSEASDPCIQLATPETCIRYAETCAALGAPWDICMLTDAITAADEGRGDIEDVNPLLTALEYDILTITEEVAETRETEDGEEYTEWVVEKRTAIYGADAILKELGITESAAKRMNAEDLKTCMAALMEERSDEERRYTAELSANTDYEGVLRRCGVSEENIERILTLYHADYLV